jgi:hypothetical protein
VRDGSGPLVGIAALIAILLGALYSLFALGE